MPKVNMRNGFSDRNAINPVNTEIQLKEFDQRTRVQLVNMIGVIYKETFGPDLYFGQEHIQDFLRYVLGTIYSQPVDIRRIYDDDPIFEMVKNTILNDDYADVLTVVEAVVKYLASFMEERNGVYYYDRFDIPSIYELANQCLKREYVGYRFVDEIIVPISDAYEIEAIQTALCNDKQIVNDHISKANKLLADRENPDYENSIKESISAVEAICELLTGIKGKSATLGHMLKKLEENGVAIHSGLKSAFNVLYGYTSDANGIRHAGDIGGPSSTFEEAKFMLVSCCAFINYLTALCAD